ncbi:hypothetical protein HRH25_18485 [Flavisolibacter sp. BT320]|nr:hypothetical protein [Flavisolibacter longurius]
MRKTVRYWLRQISCWILLLQMINLSVDPPEAPVVFPSKKQAGLVDAIPERETVYEYVSEALLNIDVPDSEEQDVVKSVLLLELFYSTPPSFTLIGLDFPLHHTGFYSSRFLSWETVPNVPPPKEPISLC